MNVALEVKSVWLEEGLAVTVQSFFPAKVLNPKVNRLSREPSFQSLIQLIL